MKEKNSDIGSLISLFFSFVRKIGTVAKGHIRPKFPNFGKFLSKIFSLIYQYRLKNFIKNFLEIMLERAFGDSPLQLNNSRLHKICSSFL